MEEYNNSIIQEDIFQISNYPLRWTDLLNKTVLVTGAGGMFARYIIYTLIYLNENKKFNIRILCLMRSEDKFNKYFGFHASTDKCIPIIQDVCDKLQYSNEIDYIFHFAGNANVTSIVNNPVDIIKTNTVGTLNIFELARKTNCKKVIFASTREIYGRPSERYDELREDSLGTLDPLDDRTCYPESKRMAENICCSYFLQYKIKYNILRIAHVYGPTMNIINDGRIMSDLLYSIINKSNIVLKSNGEMERAFCYLSDAIIGIFLVLFNAKESAVYNLANESEPIKIIDLANILADISSERGHSIDIKINQSNTQKGYFKFERKKMSLKKIEHLGWNPAITLKDGLNRCIDVLNSIQHIDKSN
ncbi:MAG: NAD-dependent epimerase/dehydratase family protein [Tannerellaceae bacterium]|jgi:nucleoside-diphosphate-sugar epimerase|nr:NAD-dependent epimerase/dehydratase family protein [Tannerellaceae bacterium]